MSTEKIVTARKDHKCDYCEELIHKGEKYLYMEMKGPKYGPSDDPEDDGPQIGVFFDKFRKHERNPPCHWPKSCAEGNHEIYHFHESDPASPICGMDISYCCNCGETEEELKKPRI